MGSIFDVFSGESAQNAANQANEYQGKSREYIGQQLNSALGSLGQNYGNARSYLQYGYGTGVQNLEEGAQQAARELSQGRSLASGVYDTARGDVQGNYGQAVGSYDQLAALGQQYNKSTQLLQDSLGVNGADAAARAQSQFKASDAYNFNLDQGLDAINRRRAAGGMLNSGNADRDAQTFGAGLASNEIGNWQNLLNSFTNPALQATQGAASGKAGVYQNEGNTLATLGTNRAGMEERFGNANASLNQTLGQNLAALSGNYGQQMAQNYQNQGNQEAAANLYTINPTAQTYNQQQQAAEWNAQQQAAASGNIWSSIFGAANLGLKAGNVGGFGGGSSGASGAYASQASPYSQYYGNGYYSLT